MSHDVKNAIRALDGATAVKYVNGVFKIYNIKIGSGWRYYDTDFREIVGQYYDQPIGPEPAPEPEPTYEYPIGPETDPGQMYAKPIGPKLPRKKLKMYAKPIGPELPPVYGPHPRENPEHHHHHGGMRCRSIILPSDEQHACAHCETVLPLGGRAYGVGSGAHVVPVCSLGCATEYARHGGSHHGG